MTQIPGHYSFVTRTLLTLFQAGDLPHVASIEVEPEYGYTTRILYCDGSLRMTRGNDVGLNSSAAAEVAADKGYTKFFLTSSGVACPEGSTFLLSWWAEQIRPKLALHGADRMRLPEEAPHYVDDALGYPVFTKPIDGSQGSSVYRCEEEGELVSALEVLEKERVRVAVVEKGIPFPDYRFVVLDDRVISVYLREPLTVVGDGTSSIEDLFLSKLETYSLQGRALKLSIRDPRVERCLHRQNLTRASVPLAGTEVPLLSVSNLSLGGSAQDVADVAAKEWKQLAITVARFLGLRYCGVDLACADIRDPNAAYSVLEVNAAPGLDHYAEVGAQQTRTVLDLYAQVLDARPAL